MKSFIFVIRERLNKEQTMAKTTNIKRYILILDKLNREPYTSTKRLLDYLEDNGLSISKRTLFRDIEAIRLEFFVEVKHSKEYDGYFIDKKESIDIDEFLHFLSLADTSNFLNDSLNDSQAVMTYMDFDRHNHGKGTEFLKPLLRAIKEHRKVNFHYERFGQEVGVHYHYRPYLLKEYLKRWYVIGVFGSWLDFKVFALDRVIDVELTDECFEPHPDLQAKRVFAERIGVSLGGKSEEVVLSFIPQQKMYIKTLPLHPSQKKLIDNEEEYRISINVAINYEVIMEILKYGFFVKVLSPQQLVDEIHNSLKKSLHYYE